METVDRIKEAIDIISDSLDEFYALSRIEGKGL